MSLGYLSYLGSRVPVWCRVAGADQYPSSSYPEIPRFHC